MPETMQDPPEAGLGGTAAIEEKIIEMATLNFERMPMLDVIFERFNLSLASALRSFAAASTEVELSELRYTTYGDAMEDLVGPCMVGIADAKPWDGPLAVAMDSHFLYSALEVLMGGHSTGKIDKPRRGFTRIESRIAERLCNLALAELSSAFAQVVDVTFEISRMEGNPQLATITQPFSHCVKADFVVTFENHSGLLSVVLPHATVEPARARLTKVFFGEKLGGDTQWRGHLTDRIQSSTVPLKAVLTEIEVPILDVLGWAPGTEIDLWIDDDHEATVLCADVPVFRGPVGRRHNGTLAIRVTEDLNARGQIAAALGQTDSEKEPVHVVDD